MMIRRVLLSVLSVSALAVSACSTQAAPQPATATTPAITPDTLVEVSPTAHVSLPDPARDLRDVLPRAAQRLLAA
jgi:hypothetical protein